MAGKRRGRFGGVAGTVGLALAGVLIAGCPSSSGGGSALSTGSGPAATSAGPVTSTPAGAATAAATSTGPGGVPVPALTAKARQHDSAGAVAYGVYFVHVLDYAYATQDVPPLRRPFTASCTLCSAVVASIGGRPRPQYTFKGGRITLYNLVMSQPSELTPVVVGNGSMTALDVTGPGGKRDRYSGKEEPRLQFVLFEKWTESGWTITRFRLGH